MRLIERNQQPRLEARIRARANSKPRCSGCGQACAGYDRMSTERRFAFIPLWNIPVDLLYTMRRVDCPDCGVKVEKVPWADGKHATCNVFRHFLATWARRLSWKDTARCFQSSDMWKPEKELQMLIEALRLELPAQPPPRITAKGELAE